jgi:hypothetical protein
MPKQKPIAIKHGERVLAVVPEVCGGPGWANSPTWVYIGSRDGTFRAECIQPDERTPELHALFSAGVAMCNALRDAVLVKHTKS